MVRHKPTVSGGENLLLGEAGAMHLFRAHRKNLLIFIQQTTVRKEETRITWGQGCIGVSLLEDQ